MFLLTIVPLNWAVMLPEFSFFISTLQHGTKNTRLDCGIVSSSPSPTSSTFPHQLKPPTPSSASVPPVSLTSTVDIVGKRLREEQLQTRVKAAQAFIEKTLGVVLPSSDLHESLKDGVILCRYGFFLPSRVCASYLNHHPRFVCVFVCVFWSCLFLFGLCTSLHVCALVHLEPSV